MPSAVPPPSVQQRCCAAQWINRSEALDVGATGADGEGIEGEATDGEGVRAGSADVGGGDRHLQKRGGHQPAGGG